MAHKVFGLIGKGITTCFGEDVSITIGQANPKTIRAEIYQNPAEAFDDGGSAGLLTTETFAYAQPDDVVGVSDGDQLTYDSVSYIIREPQESDAGLVEMKLEKS